MPYFTFRGVQVDYEEALKNAHLAVEHDPLSSYAQTILCIVAYPAGFV